MLSISDIKVGKVISYEGAPYQVVKAEHSKQARSAAVLRVKMKNLISGQVLDNTFQQSDSIEPAHLQNKKANYQYKDEDGLTFMDNETYEQFTLDNDAVGDNVNFVKEGEDVDVMYYEEKPVSISLPPKVVLEVVQSPPGIKGDSASNVTKKVKVETDYELSVPLFINKGDKVRINTETGEYVERATA